MGCPSSPFRCPFGLRFGADDLDELNFLSILTILNFLSAYRIPLHERTGQGAYDCIRRFVLGCYISGLQDEGTSLMTAEGMVNLNEHRVSELLNIPVMVEKDHPTLPVKIGERDADATEIVGLVLKVMQETGRILQQQGKKDLGTWVADVLRGTTDMTPVERTDRLVKQVIVNGSRIRAITDTSGHRSSSKPFLPLQIMARLRVAPSKYTRRLNSWHSWLQWSSRAEKASLSLCPTRM